MQFVTSRIFRNKAFVTLLIFSPVRLRCSLLCINGLWSTRH